MRGRSDSAFLASMIVAVAMGILAASSGPWRSRSPVRACYSSLTRWARAFELRSPGAHRAFRFATTAESQFHGIGNSDAM